MSGLALLHGIMGRSVSFFIGTAVAQPNRTRRGTTLAGATSLSKANSTEQGKEETTLEMNELSTPPAGTATHDAEQGDPEEPPSNNSTNRTPAELGPAPALAPTLSRPRSITHKRAFSSWIDKPKPSPPVLSTVVASPALVPAADSAPDSTPGLSRPRSITHKRAFSSWAQKAKPSPPSLGTTVVDGDTSAQKPVFYLFN